MSYKTKFRDIEMPQNAEGFKSIGHDANSLRSYGAAFYREVVRTLPQNLRAKMVDIVVKSLHLAIEPYLKEINRSDMIPRERRGIVYILQGIQRASRKSEDRETEKYAERAILELKK